jgi:hypothetical protein
MTATSAGDGKSWVLFVACRSARHWSATKKNLSFCRLTQDREDEGCLRLQQLPAAAQAIAIRDALGIQKRRAVSAAELERLKAFAFDRKPRSEARFEPGRANATSRYPNHPPSKRQKFQPSPPGNRASRQDADDGSFRGYFCRVT